MTISRGGILILTHSGLTDRMLLYSNVLRTLARDATVTVWAKSFGDERGRAAWGRAQAAVEPFPEVLAFPEIPHNRLRRLNEFAWDFRLSAPSRLSMQRHVRDRSQRLAIRSLKVPARALAWLHAEGALERLIQRLLLSYRRSPEAEGRLRTSQPEVLVTTGPFNFAEPAVPAAAKGIGIRTLALIPSWDNLSTKGRMVVQHDGYLVWSEEGRRQLHEFYPASCGVPVYVVGAPQFDVFFQRQFLRSREEFAAGYGLRADRPIVVYAVGSPNFLKERYGALDMASRVARGELGDIQLVVRPHPVHDKAEMAGLFSGFGHRVVLQQAARAQGLQNEMQIVDWVNTFRHADVVVNLSSTVTVDAALCDRPVVNLDYDPEPGQPNQRLVEDVNHLWTHFKPVAESGGVWLARTPDETAQAVRRYLCEPSLHREGRRRIVRLVCGEVDGRSGEKLAGAILEFARRGRNGLPGVEGTGDVSEGAAKAACVEPKGLRGSGGAS